MKKPIAIFANNSSAALFWFGCCIILIGALIITPLLIVKEMKGKTQFVVVDPSATFYVGAVKNFDEIKEVHDYCVTIATASLLMKNPTGYDDIPQLEQICVPAIAKKAMDEWELEKEYYTENRIHQKVEKQKINITETTNDYIVAEVRGQIIQSGLVGESHYDRRYKFILYVKMARNARLGHNKHLPLLVVDYNIQTKEIKEEE